MKAGHEIAFKPAKTVKEPVKASYAHLNDNWHKKKEFRDEEGAVITAPRNLYTNKPKVGQSGKQCYFGGAIPYKEDEYDLPKEKARKERLAHEAKVQEKPFSQRVPPRATFNKEKEVFGEDVEIKARPPPAKRKPPMEHEVPFKPSNPAKKGHNKTLNKFPEYKENPPKPLVRKVVNEEDKKEDDDRPNFRPTYNLRSKPCQSVATNLKNLKASFPTVFKR